MLFAHSGARCFALPRPARRAQPRAVQVTSDVGKFAGDEVITEQTTQTFSAVLGTTETMSGATVDAITEALNEARGP